LSNTELISPENIHELLAQVGLPYEYNLISLKGGRNNRVFKLQCGGRDYFLKAYFYSSADRRDRLNHEYSFTDFAWKNGVRTVPEPLAALSGQRLALYEFIVGKIANYRPTTTADIGQATDFVLSINNHRVKVPAGKLPPASEACFSIADHIENTMIRVNRLAQMKVFDDYDIIASNRIEKYLLPLWAQIIDKININRKKNPCLNKTLSAEQRWISPSDFGFHNAIEENSGKLRFIDFEYAGWDDPAKLLCDFANQPDRILENSLSQKFIRDIISADVNPEFLQYRYALVEPLYQIKWACIIMNDFLPGGDLRTAFTKLVNIDENKKNQLEKLQIMLDRVNDTIKSNEYYRN